MKKLFPLFVLFITLISAQTYHQKVNYKVSEAFADNGNALVWIYLTDKGPGQNKYFDNPETVVSKKSLARRAKVMNGQNLIDKSDLPLNKNYLKILEDAGIKIKQRSKWFNSVSAYITEEQLQVIENLAFVRKIDLVAKLKSSLKIEEGLRVEVPVKLNKQSSIGEFNYGESFEQLNVMSVPDLHLQGLSGNGVTICLMDAGFDLLSHEAFSNMNISATWDFVNGDIDVENGSDMGSGSHGTKTLSTIGGFKQGKIIGPAFNAEYLLAKTENTDSETPLEEDNWLAAMEWADSLGADITSTSLSYLDYDSPFQSYTWEDMDGNTALITRAGDLAVKKGIVVVNSAGNNGFNPDHNTLGAPADGDSIIAAGAINMNGERASFSSVGNTVDGRIKPDFMTPGVSIYCAANYNTAVYTYASGTSFSCPLLSGVIALMLEDNPNLTPMEIRDILRATSSNSQNPDREYGWGNVDALAAVNASITNVKAENLSPSEYKLLQNYPNPFNPTTKIKFTIPTSPQTPLLSKERSRGEAVTLKVYDLLGREVTTLLNQPMPAGTHEIEFDASDLPSGIYFYKFSTGSFTETKKMTLMK